MFLKFTKVFGKPICVVLYAVFTALAVKFTVIPLAALLLMHFTEYLIIGRKIAKENGMSVLDGFLECMCFGFTWWLPVKKASEDNTKSN